MRPALPGQYAPRATVQPAAGWASIRSVRDPIRFEHRMSDSDALMWHIEKDPLLRSTITVVWWLDRVPDRDRLTDRIERATRIVPRLRQRVMSNPYSIAPPRWELDPHFDVRFHVRWLAAPDDGSLRAVLDYAEPVAMQGFDRARPLWELSIIEGLAGSKAAMILKVHHSLSDGVGLVRMTSALVETSGEPTAAPRAMPRLPQGRVLTQPERVWDALGHEWRRGLGRVRRVATAVPDALGALVSDPAESVAGMRDLASSVGRLLRPSAEPLSPLMQARSPSMRFDTLSLPVNALRAAAKHAHCTMNDAFVAGVAGDSSAITRRTTSTSPTCASACRSACAKGRAGASPETSSCRRGSSCRSTSTIRSRA